MTTYSSRGTAVLEKLLPLAHAHSLRIVSIYRRGYSPSSGFQDRELAGIGFGKKIEEAEPFYRAQGVEIATFLINFATEQGIPLADPNSPTGGIVLIGWSLGGVHATALLAYLDELPEDARSTLQKYLHTILFHGEIALQTFTLISSRQFTLTPFRRDCSCIRHTLPGQTEHRFMVPDRRPQAL